MTSAENKSLHGVEGQLQTPFLLQWIPDCPRDRVHTMPRVSVVDTLIDAIPWGLQGCIPPGPGHTASTQLSELFTWGRSWMKE